MTEKDFNYLQKIETEVDKAWDALSIWEKNFIEDILERFRTYGRNTKMSPRQWEIVVRIADKIV